MSKPRDHVTAIAFGVLMVGLTGAAVISHERNALSISLGVILLGSTILSFYQILVLKKHLHETAQRLTNNTETDFSKATQTAIAEQEELRRKDTSRREIILRLCTQLRSPANEIRAHCKRIIPNDLTGLLRRIDMANDEILTTVNRTIELMELDMGQDHHTVETINIANIAEECTRSLAAAAAKKNITLACKKSPDNHECNTDYQKVRAILMEGLLNAINHSEATNITVDTYGNTTHVVCKITDNGNGIMNAKESFKPFSGTRHRGLGLALATQRAQRIQSQLTLENRSAGGTDFTLSLPRLTATAPLLG